MKNLILIALILQLVITIKDVNTNPTPKPNTKYKFGDVIEFPRLCATDKSKPLYSHYGVYVGPKSMVDVGQGDNDIFHRAGKFSCGFGKLEEIKTNQENLANYLDGKGFTAGTEEQIKARILEFKKPETCERYSPINNNCEHLATRVRYDYKSSKQAGTVAECVLDIKEPAKNFVMSTLEHMQREIQCDNGF